MLLHVREPIRWCTRLGTRMRPTNLAGHFRDALRGSALDAWSPPAWLLPHQTDAARRVAGRLVAHGGALLCDAVGLGKTYVALAVATRYREPVVVAPAVLIEQWRRVARAVGVPIRLASHESLSRGKRVPRGDVTIVDEAHHYRHAATARYRQLAAGVGASPVLLLTATPVVNRPRDLMTLVRLFAHDRSLAAGGVPSVEHALTQRRTPELSMALADVIVARSPEVVGLSAGAIPAACDEPVIRAPVLPGRLQSCAVAVLDALEFPAFSDRSAAALLRIGAYHRLASSVSAFRECLQRHIAYLDRAIDAAGRGERLSRRTARVLFARDDELQLALPFPSLDTAPVEVDALERDRDRLRALLARIPRDLPSPKTSRLVSVVDAARVRTDGKVLVFTTAVATTLEIARRLEWRRVAAVTGRGARIASGAVPVHEALRAFCEGDGRVVIDTLVATDLFSEGLDLQAASTVVHFDLPWNPVRLQQRIGRAARLGSTHRAVAVSWFAPTPDVDRALRLGARIRVKAAAQRALGVSVTSRIGRARMLGRALERRERLIPTLPTEAAAAPGFSVVAGAPAAAFAVRWRYVDHTETTLLVFEGEPAHRVDDLERACDLVESLLHAAPIARPFPDALSRALSDELRRRIAVASHAPTTSLARRLTHRLVRRAVRAGRDRDVATVERLDLILDRISQGVRAGAERHLHALLEGDSTNGALDGWLTHWRAAGRASPIAEVAAAVAAVPD